MKKGIELNSRKVLSLLATLNHAEFRYCELQMSMARDARNLIREFDLSKEVFCERMSVSVKKYESILSGSFPFALQELAKMQAMRIELGAEADAKERAKEISKTMTDIPSPQRK